jgi:hypothetical protein
MRYTWYRYLTLCLFAFTGICCYGQTGVLVIPNSVGNGDYIEQQMVRLVAPSGKVTPSGVGQGHLYIDKTIVHPNAVSSTANIPTVLPPHNKNLPVGTIDGLPSVDLNGAANYSIKLDIPPGTNGMVPDLSINYNSNFGDYQLGIGWSIGGVSVIKREHSTIFSDSQTQSFDPNCTTYWSATAGIPTCPIYLDGVKLVPDGSTTNTFYLHNDNFSKITYFSTGSYFLVETKNGTKMEYGKNGSTNNSLRKIVSNTKDYAWYLNKVYDNYGNYMEYTYYNVGNEIALKEIKYTGNSTSAQAPYNSIKFYYNKRVDPLVKYFYNDVVKQELQLREIETFNEGTSVFKYQFKYAFDEFNYLGFAKINKVFINKGL